MELTYKLHELDLAVEFILKNSSSKTLLFYGEMGAGKTTLIKKLVRALGATDTVSSPTFSLVNHYESDTGPIFHFDFYRIDQEEEALDIGFNDYLDSGTWNLIEWPERIEKLLNGDEQKLLIEPISESTRKLKFC